MNNYNSNTTDNQKEQLVEVDEKDNVIGPISREECHNQTRKPWHRTTHIYLFDNKGNLYFTQRSVKKDTAAGLWTISAGGHLRWGKTPEETAEREILEELKVKADLELIDKLTVDYGTEREVISIFSGVTNEKPRINEEEVQQIKSFPLKEVIEKFNSGEFKLSGGSTHSFQHLIGTGVLKDYRDKYLSN